MHFRNPVDFVRLGLPDYPKVIKKMMDLKKVKENLADDQYESVEECLADIQLIWDNCKLYNTEDSPIYKLALTMEAHSAKLTADLFGVLKKKGTQLEPQKPKERNQSGSPELANQDFD